MGRASISLVDSPMSEDWEGPYTADKISRAERRWKRREVLVLPNCSGSTSKTVKSHGNMAVPTDKIVHIVEDEIDEDYKMFLDAYVSDIDCANANNVSDIDINTGYNNDNDDDADPDYKMFLENMLEEGNSYVYSLQNGLKLDSTLSKDLTHNRAGNVRNTRSGSMREQTRLPMKSQQSLDPKRGPCNKRPSSVPQNISRNDVEFDVDEDYQLFMNSCRLADDDLGYTNDELIRKRSTAWRNSRVSNHASYTPEVHSEIDEDYQLFLNSDGIADDDLVCMPDKNTTNAPEVEGTAKRSSARKNSRVSNHTSYTPEVHSEIDEDYQLFLNSDGIADDDLLCMPDKNTANAPEVEGKSKRSSARKNSRVSNHTSYTPEVHSEIDEDYQLFLNSDMIVDDNLVYMPDKNTPKASEVEGTTKRSSARKNFLVSNHASFTPEVHSEVDEDYQLFLNSGRIVDDDLVYMPDKSTTKASEVEGTTKASEVDGDSISSDSDLVIIEPNLFCEDTPFVSSNVYDSIWWEDEANPEDDKHFSAYDHHSQFRRRLMECLQKPFDQQEFDADLQLVCKQTQMEGHKETRQGRKSFQVSGYNKSYLELNPDLAKAIDAVKEPHRVSFLLRGFFFYLGNVSHQGAFKPWLDKSCQKILQNM